MNGVDINDNVLGTPNNLFIEDAIQEVQVLGSGVSAATAGSGGGVINVITRSGGNAFSGAFRTNLTNPAWIKETPFERAAGTSRASKLSPTYEFTAGGPVLRDRLWFFGGARAERTTNSTVFRPDAHSLRQHQRQHALRREADRHDRAWTDAARHVHRQSDGPASAVARREHRSGNDHVAVDAEPHPRRDLARHAGDAYLRGGAVLAEAVAPRARRRHQRRDRRLTVPDPRTVRHASQSALQRPYFDSSDPEERNNQQFTAASRGCSRRAGSARTR
jgi:hypothetical protein